MNEFELKYMLTKHQFRCLREFIKNYFKYQYERTKQINYYYDTQDRYYYRMNSTVRIREKDGVLFGTVSVIRLMPLVLVINALFMVVVSFLASMVPLLMLKRIKPIEIIKAKE